MAMVDFDAMKEVERSEMSAGSSKLGIISSCFWNANRYDRYLSAGETGAIVQYVTELRIAWREIRTINVQLTWKSEIEKEMEDIDKELLKIKARLERNARAKIQQNFIERVRSLHKRMVAYAQIAGIGLPIRIDTSMERKLRNALALSGDKHDEFD